MASGGRVCSRPGSSLTLVGVRADSAEAGALEAAADLVLEAARLSRLTPGSSLKVWMVRARLSMTVVVVTLEEEDVMEEAD